MTAACLFLLGLVLVAPIIAWAVEPPQVGETAADFELPSLAGGKQSLTALKNQGPVVLVVLRGFPGYQCPLCHRQVAEFLGQAESFRKAGAQVVFVYPGPSKSLAARAKEFLKEQKVPDDFHLLIDPDYTLTNKYGLRWKAPKETAYPSTFIIQPSGKISYALVSREHGGRSKASDVLEQLARSPRKD
jgi:peroxiredoxin Q/BCP